MKEIQFLRFPILLLCQKQLPKHLTWVCVCFPDMYYWMFFNIINYTSGNLIEKDPILQHMGNITLALHVLGEFVNASSFWQPYLRILPSSFSNTLYFTPDELKLLKGSPAYSKCFLIWFLLHLVLNKELLFNPLCYYFLGEVIKQFRNISRQYSYFYRLLQDLPEAKSWPIRDFFTFDSYRWVILCFIRLFNYYCFINKGGLYLLLWQDWIEYLIKNQVDN